MKRKNSTCKYTLRTASEQAFRLAALNMPAMQFVMYGTILAILWFGGNILTIGGIGVGNLRDS